MSATTGSGPAPTTAPPAAGVARRGPLTVVLESFAEGVHSFDEIAARSGLPLDVVRASVDHLVRAGLLEAKELAIGCPTGGCTSCASGTTDGAAGCGAAGPSDGRSGPVLVTISLRRPGA